MSNGKSGGEWAGLRFLVVEDDAHIRRLIRRILEDEGAEVVEAGDGTQAIRLLLQELDLACVVLDFNLPNVNGNVVLEFVAKTERLRHLPVVMISAEQGLELRAEALRLGAVFFVQKPFQPRAFRSVLHTVVTGGGAERRRERMGAGREKGIAPAGEDDKPLARGRG